MVSMHRRILRNPAKATLKAFLGQSLGSVITPAHLLLDTFTESMLNELSDQALLIFALVAWHIDATSDIRQLLIQQRHTPDQVRSEAPQILPSAYHHLITRSLECSDKFNAMCGILYERYNELVEVQVTRDIFANELQRLLGYLKYLFMYCVESELLSELSQA
ncbi:hypothetical protein BJY01DRAFT_213212 [Aspergillus pseudoustus]|uniref:Uncharacterized protein n=1 Tax=Aspergillus pseudoustus TaxID=1810923 RepID=A0ABR4K3H6_9EURO